jgi:Zn finger protein HypA/HybF involved in hydrogenase expression
MMHNEKCPYCNKIIEVSYGEQKCPKCKKLINVFPDDGLILKRMISISIGEFFKCLFKKGTL